MSEPMEQQILHDLLKTSGTCHTFYSKGHTEFFIFNKKITAVGHRFELILFI